MKACSRNILVELMERYPALSVCRGDIEAACEMLIGCYRQGGKVLICGNGGSAADSEHIVGELMKSFKMARPIEDAFKDVYQRVNGEETPRYLEGALPAIALVSHTALSTAFSNDEAAEGIFAQQVYGYGCAGDILIAISTSGTSPNVIAAAKVARAKSMVVIALMGDNEESQLSRVSDIAIHVSECETFRVQELHLPIYHALCAAVEAEIFEGDSNACTR